MLANYFYYKNLYTKQISYINELLSRQVQIVGQSVDATNNGFISELNQIFFNEDPTEFFSNANSQKRAQERMELFFSKNEQFVTGIRFYDNKKNEFTLKQDSETKEWLEQPFVLHAQAEIYSMEKLVEDNRRLEK